MTLRYLSGDKFAPPVERALFVSYRGGVAHAKGDHSAAFGARVIGKSGSDDGVFAEWSWDGHALRAGVDRCGFYPLYVYRNGADVGVSTSIASLLALGADRELDHEAIALAIRLGQFVGDDTPFRRIRVLGPSGTLRWQGGVADISERPEIVRTAQQISRDAAIDAYIEAFRAAIGRRVPTDRGFAVPLSGGRDSRHILFELARSGSAPAFCATYVTTPEDMKVAREVCRRLGVRHVAVDEPADPFAAEVRKNWCTNFGVDEGVFPMAIADALRANGATAVFDGIGGDVLSAGLFLSRERLAYFESGRLRDFAEDLLTPSDAILEKLLDPGFLRACPREAAIERLLREVRRHEVAHNPVTSYFFWNRTRRKIAQIPFGMYSGLPRVFAPYVDHEVLDLLMSLPAELSVDHTLHTDAIVRAYPDLADIPFEDKAADGSYDRQVMYSKFARGYAQAAMIASMPSVLNAGALRSRLAVSSVWKTFGANQQWFLRPALWLHQLGALAGGR